VFGLIGGSLMIRIILNSWFLNPTCQINELRQLGQQLNLPPRELDLQGYIVDPDELERFRIPPPTIVVLHDGLPDGDFVSQFLRCKYQ
jgi:hypothetical protein